MSNQLPCFSGVSQQQCYVLLSFCSRVCFLFYFEVTYSSSIPIILCVPRHLCDYIDVSHLCLIGSPTLCI